MRWQTHSRPRSSLMDVLSCACGVLSRCRCAAGCCAKPFLMHYRPFGVRGWNSKQPSPMLVCSDTKHQWHVVMFRHKKHIVRFGKWLALKCDANSWVKVMCVSLLWPASNQLNLQCAQLQSVLHSVSRSSWLLFWHAPSICPDHTGLLFCLYPAHRPSSWHFLPCCSSFPRRHLFGPFLLHTHMWTCYLSASQHRPVRPDSMRNVWNCPLCLVCLQLCPYLSALQTALQQWMSFCPLCSPQ